VVTLTEPAVSYRVEVFCATVAVLTEPQFNVPAPILAAVSAEPSAAKLVLALTLTLKLSTKNVRAALLLLLCRIKIALLVVIPEDGAVNVQVILLQIDSVAVAPVLQAVVPVFVPSLE
jgi:hypothetical protein